MVKTVIQKSEENSSKETLINSEIKSQEFYKQR